MVAISAGHIPIKVVSLGMHLLLSFHAWDEIGLSVLIMFILGTYL